MLKTIFYFPERNKGRIFQCRFSVHFIEDSPKNCAQSEALKPESKFQAPVLAQVTSSGVASPKMLRGQCVILGE